MLLLFTSTTVEPFIRPTAELAVITMLSKAIYSPVCASISITIVPFVLPENDRELSNSDHTKLFKGDETPDAVASDSSVPFPVVLARPAGLSQTLTRNDGTAVDDPKSPPMPLA